jgi:Zn-dependent protease/predicted transcriptional regulator
MFESSFRLGTLWGIRIGVHYTWLIIFVLMTSSLYTVFITQHPDWSSRTCLFTAVVTSMLFFLSIILHELGHSIMAINRGIRVRSITLFIFGGVAQTEKEPDSPSTEFWVAIAGPIVSFVLAAVFYTLDRLFGDFSVVAAESLQWLASINLMVALFNLVPGFPLDGGRVFRAIVWGVTQDAQKGMRWAVMSGRLLAYALMGLGLLTVMQTGQVLSGLWTLGIGWFLLAAAEASGQAFTINRVLSRIGAYEAMNRDVPYVEADTSIADWIESYVLPSGQRAFMVKQNNQTVGLVTMSDCKDVSREQWPALYVRDIMTPTARLHTVTPDTDLAEVLRNMGIYSLNQVPVVDKGEVIGWIDRQRIMKILQMHTQSHRE